VRQFASLIAVLLAFLASLGSAAGAEELPANVLARNRWMELTRADYEAALSRVPESLRQEFGISPKRVQGLLNALLVNKTLAAQARAHGIEPHADSRAEGGFEFDKSLAARELQRIEADAGADFDAKRALFESKAREIYALDREKFRIPEEVRLSDIAVSIKERGEANARARAEEARRKLAEGFDFAAVAREYSDDPTTRDKGGALPFVTAPQLTPEYAKAVFALSRVGEISLPIKAPMAWHVVRLDDRRPSRIKAFDECRDEIMKQLRVRHVQDARDARLKSIYRDPDLVLNQAAIDALVIPIDPKLSSPVPEGSSATPLAVSPPSPTYVAPRSK
jgi:peptidyl-prolyl cis-trans isomerase C